MTDWRLYVNADPYSVIHKQQLMPELANSASLSLTLLENKAAPAPGVFLGLHPWHMEVPRQGVE